MNQDKVCVCGEFDSIDNRNDNVLVTWQLNGLVPSSSLSICRPVGQLVHKISLAAIAKCIFMFSTVSHKHGGGGGAYNVVQFLLPLGVY